MRLKEYQKDLSRFGPAILLGLIGGLIGFVVQYVWGLCTQCVAIPLIGGTVSGAFQLFHSSTPTSVSQLLDMSSGFIAGFIAGLSVANVPIVATHLEWKFFPPTFIRSDLTAERRRTVLSEEQGAGEFLGRNDILAHLLRFATAGEKPFLWTVLIGPTGVGKTRLAIEWLGALQSKGWDGGFVGHYREGRPIPTGWRPRRKTALVIDESEREWSGDLVATLLRLGAEADDASPVRVLVLGEIEPAVMSNDVESRLSLRNSRIEPNLHLNGLDETESLVLWATSGGSGTSPADLIKETQGRPRAILLMARAAPETASYSEALAHWVEKVIPGLSDHPGDSAVTLKRSLLKSLALSVLAGPVPLQAVRQVSNGVLEKGTLHPYFSHIDTEQVLPAFAPKELGREILARTLLVLENSEIETIFNVAVTKNAAAVETTLGDLWGRLHRTAKTLREAGPSKDRNTKWAKDFLRILVNMQKNFDARCETRVLQFYARIKELIERQRAEHGKSVGDVLVTIEALAQRRPFDIVVQELLAIAEALSIPNYGKEKDWSEVELRGARLAEILKGPVSSDALLHHVTVGAELTVIEYCRAQRWKDSERWGEHLDALLSSQQRNRVMALSVARASCEAIKCYSKSQNWRGVELWGRRLNTIVRRFRLDAEMCGLLAEAASSAASAYFRASYCSAGERWANTLDAIANRFLANGAIQFLMAQASMAAVIEYGANGVSAGLEHWHRRLANVIAAHPSDEEIRTVQAYAAYNAIKSCASAGMEGEARRWFGDLSGVFKRFPDNRSIAAQYVESFQEIISVCGRNKNWEEIERCGLELAGLQDLILLDDAMTQSAVSAAVNAINAYGRIKHWQRLEEWGEVLARIVNARNSAERAALELKGVVNALTFYDEAGMVHDERRARWLSRLAQLARMFPNFGEIQDYAGHFGVNLSNQLRKTIGI